MTKIKIAWLKLCISILIVYAFSTNFIHIPEPKAADGLAIIIAIIWAVKSIFVIRRESKKELLKEAIKESLDPESLNIICSGCNYPDNPYFAKRCIKCGHRLDDND